jgi:hypothetical protein
VVVSLLAGLRTEEVRALRWGNVVAWVHGQWRPVADAGFDHDQVAVFVWRAERAGGDTKTPKSRRTLALRRLCVLALWEQRVRQAKDRIAAGPLWQDHNLVFASAVGTAQDDHNVRRQFGTITEAAGLGTSWVPRELRHTFVSVLSAHGVSIEAIAAGRAQPDRDDRTRLPAPDRPRPHQGSSGHGSDLPLTPSAVRSLIRVRDDRPSAGCRWLTPSRPSSCGFRCLTSLGRVGCRALNGYRTASSQWTRQQDWSAFSP